MKQLVLISFLAIFVLSFPQSTYGMGAIRDVTPGNNTQVFHLPKEVILHVSARENEQGSYVYILFQNLKKVKTISYLLTYKTGGRMEGVSGTILPEAVNGAIALNQIQPIVTRKILLGTCSQNSCIYHKNITDMKLKVVIDYKSGLRYSRRFPITVSTAPPFQSFPVPN